MQQYHKILFLLPVQFVSLLNTGRPVICVNLKYSFSAVGKYVRHIYASPRESCQQKRAFVKKQFIGQNISYINEEKEKGGSTMGWREKGSRNGRKIESL